MLVNYASNPKLSDSKDIGLISLAQDVFVFTTKINFNSDHKLDFNFNVCNETATKEYGFYIKNTEFIGYTLSPEGLETIPFIHDDNSIFYFDEEFQIKNEKLYKKVTEKDSALENWTDYYLVDGKTFAHKDKPFKLIKKGNTYTIIKEINNIKPIAMGSIINGVKNESILYDDTECVSDEKVYRIITSEDCKLISLWIKNSEDEIFKKIKTFSYPGGIEKAGIKLSVDDSMELNQLSFSFLQANV